MSVRSSLPLALVLALAACGKGDRQDGAATPIPPSAGAPQGPDNLVLRIPVSGGEARVFAYPRLDTVVWRTSGVPAPQRVLAFDDEAGTIAYVTAKGEPARLDLRQGGAAVATKARLSSITSADGSAIYGVAADGTVERTAPSGSWRWKPPRGARALFPQPDGTLLVLAERPGGAVVWRVRPPSTRILDSVELPRVERALRTQVGDRLYLASGSDLAGVRTRTMRPTATIGFADPVELLAATPSGDRVFVVTRTSTAIDVVDRYRERTSGSIELGRHPSELRVDALGRYLLARPEGADSAVVVALATNRVAGAVATRWRPDLPFVAPDGALALAQGSDVLLVDGETLRPTTRVRGGSSDFWYPFRWTGFRPRDARLDRPADFSAIAESVATVAESAAAPLDTAAPPPSRTRDTVARRPAGFTVSFAALLSENRARELASQIHVNGEAARVAVTTRDGTTVYRVVLGPYATREEAERAGRDSRQSYWVYEGGP